MSNAPESKTFYSLPWEDWEMEKRLSKQLLNPPMYGALTYNCWTWSRDVIHFGYGAPSPKSSASRVCR